MTISDITKHYVKTFKNGPSSSETRCAYERLKQCGEALGVDLTKDFFRKLLDQYQQNPKKCDELTVDELNQDILFQCYEYMQRFQEQSQDNMKKEKRITSKERRTSFEIL